MRVVEELAKKKSIRGLLDILEETVSEERALAIIAELEEIFGGPSPYEDPVIELIDAEKKLYALADPRYMKVFRAKLEGGRLIRKEVIAFGIPTSVEEHFDPETQTTLYRVVWRQATSIPPITIGPATIDEIVKKLKANGLVIHYRIAKPVLAAIIKAYAKKFAKPEER